MPIVQSDPTTTRTPQTRLALKVESEPVDASGDVETSAELQAGGKVENMVTRKKGNWGMVNLFKTARDTLGEKDANVRDQ